MDSTSSSSVSANSTVTVTVAMNLPSSASAHSTTISTAMDLPSTVSTSSTTVTAVGIMNLTSTTVYPSSTTVSAVMNLPSSNSANSTTAVDTMLNLTSTTVSPSSTTAAAMDLPSMVSSSSTTTSVSASMDLPSPASDNSTTVSTSMDQQPSSSVSDYNSTTTTVSTAIDLPSTVSANSTTVTAVTDLSSAVASPSSTTTVPVYDIIEINCLPINDTNIIVNTTSVADGTVVHVACKPSFTLVAPRVNTDFVTCLGGRWIPLTPKCNPVQSNSAPVGVIVGCTIGGLVCLVLVIVALYMLNKSIKERKDQRERNKEFYDKMDQIGLYINESFQDHVGMPVLTMDTRDTDLRGRVALSTSNPSASSEKEEPPDAGKLGADLF
jgi:hypothetical protein